MSAGLSVPRILIGLPSWIIGAAAHDPFSRANLTKMSKNGLEYCFKYSHIFRSEGTLDRLGIEMKKFGESVQSSMNPGKTALMTTYLNRPHNFGKDLLLMESSLYCQYQKLLPTHVRPGHHYLNIRRLFPGALPTYLATPPINYTQNHSSFHLPSTIKLTPNSSQPSADETFSSQSTQHPAHSSWKVLTDAAKCHH